MPNGSSPPSNKSFGAPALGSARGIVRDALAGVSNLDQLLRSVRIGPKALGPLLPDIHDSCGPLRSAVNEILAGIGAALPDSDGLTELRAFITPRIDELESVLFSGKSKPVNAKVRLRLEQVVGRIASELEAARGLLDLLEEAVWAPEIRVQLGELLSAALECGARPQAPNTLRAKIIGLEHGVELVVKPRVMISLLTLGTNQFARGDRDFAIVIDKQGAGCTIQLGPHAGPGRLAEFSLQTVIDPTLACMRSAAKLMGAECSEPAGTFGWVMRWPLCPSAG